MWPCRKFPGAACACRQGAHVLHRRKGSADQATVVLVTGDAVAAAM
jgi:hypothetical protein